MVLSRESKKHLLKEGINQMEFLEELEKEYPKYEFVPKGDIQMCVKLGEKSFFLQGEEKDGVVTVDNVQLLIVVKANK